MRIVDLKQTNCISELLGSVNAIFLPCSREFNKDKILNMAGESELIFRMCVDYPLIVEILSQKAYRKSNTEVYPGVFEYKNFFCVAPTKTSPVGLYQVRESASAKFNLEIAIESISRLNQFLLTHITYKSSLYLPISQNGYNDIRNAMPTYYEFLRKLIAVTPNNFVLFQH